MNTENNITPSKEGVNTSKNKNKSLYIAAAVLGIAVLIAGSFLIGRSIGVSQEDKDTKKDEDTSEVATADTSDVFDSTEEEIEAIKEEQEKLEQENEEKIEEVKEELAQANPEKEFVLSEEYELSSTTGSCVYELLYNKEEDLPISQGPILNYANGEASFTCLNQGALGRLSEVVDKGVLSDYFTQSTLDKIQIVVLEPNVEDTEFDTYKITGSDIDNIFTFKIKKQNSVAGNFLLNVKSGLDKVEQVVTTETYTNPFFPDFKLVYPSDWKFSTITNSSTTPGLLSRNITLTKEGREISIYTAPELIEPCLALGPDGYTSAYSNYTLFQDFGNGTVAAGNRYVSDSLTVDDSLLFFAPENEIECPIFDIETNISNDNFNLSDDDGDVIDGVIQYKMLITSNIEYSDSLSQEAADIIRNSVIR